MPAARDRKPAPRRLPRPPSLASCPAPTIRAVTRNLASDFQRHGEDSVGTGEVIHQLLEEISNGKLTADSSQLTAEIKRLLRLAGLVSSPLKGEDKGEGDSLSASILSTVQSLKSNVSVWSIISPQPNSEAELPVMYRDESGTVWTGRIDRVIFDDKEVRVYDYKTFPIKKADIETVAREYHENQLRYYAEACRGLYPEKKVRTFLVFTALPAIVETGSPDR